MDDCEVGAGKKACKNCTCGRADAEAAVQKVDLSQDMLENPQSACGSVGPLNLQLVHSIAAGLRQQLMTNVVCAPLYHLPFHASTLLLFPTRGAVSR